MLRLRARGEGSAAAEEGVGAGRSTDVAGRLREGGGRRGNLPQLSGEGKKRGSEGVQDFSRCTTLARELF